MAASKRTIAFISDSVLPFNKGGKETRIRHLTQGLARLGHDVHIYTMQWWSGGSTLRQDGITYHAISKLHPLYAGNRRSIKQGLMFGLACLNMLRYDYDVLEVDHMPYFPLFALKLVSLIKRRPMYATWHEVWGRSYWRQYLGWSGLFAYVIERASVLLPDEIIAVSPHTASQLRKVLNYKGPIRVVPNGIDYAHIASLPPSTDTSDVLYAGRLLSHKNVDMLIQAVARLRMTRPNIRLMIVGDGPEYKSLKELVAAQDLQAHVVMKGFVSTSDEVYSLMKASRVFVLPSTREGFGISILEAAACGLPVITVDHPNNAARHLVTTGMGLLCAPTVSGISMALKAMLAEPNTKPATPGPDFDWSQAVRAVAEVYTS